MENSTTTGIRGTILSGGPPTKTTGDGSSPLTGEEPAVALSVGGEKPTTTQAPADGPRITAASKQIDFASCTALCAGAAGGRICARAPGAFGGAISMPPDARVRAVGGALLHV